MDKNSSVVVDFKGSLSNIALIQLNHPKTFNTLSDDLMKEVNIDVYKLKVHNLHYALDKRNNFIQNYFVDKLAKLDVGNN